ncbi:MAG: glycerophosphodiester phosphodiesterase [Epsilonproteobacteria bacterium]|nr:glycerophosphodiester phosphodiesterase [Campylobacterota bacterium]
MSFWENFDKNRKLIVAHRGARSIRPENTMSAFKAAMKNSDFIELDVSFSKDGVPIIIHDNTLERTSNVKELKEFKKPYRVKDYTYKQLLKLDFGSWFIRDDPFKTIENGTVKIEELKALKTQRILTLDQVLKVLKKHNFPVNIEIKDLSRTAYDKTAVKTIIDIIEKHVMLNLVLLSSFNHKYLRQAFKINPNIDTAALEGKNHSKDLVKHLKRLRVRSYNPALKIADEDLIKHLNSAGIFVNIFTVNDKEDRLRLFKEGAKAVFTDVLE